MAEGPKLLEEALAAGAAVQAVYLDVQAARAEHRALAERARSHGAAVVPVEAGGLQRAADAVTPQPVTSIVAMLHVPLDTLPLDGLTVVSAGLQDPGNAGTVLRSAWAAGWAGMVSCAGGVDIYNPKAVRASAGAIFHLPVVCGPEPEEVLAYLGRAGVPRVGTVVQGGRDHDGFDWTSPVALVLGTESHGLAQSLEAVLEDRVTIPMHPGTESLNVAMAATVLFFEADRQRRRSSAAGAA